MCRWAEENRKKKELCAREKFYSSAVESFSSFWAFTTRPRAAFNGNPMRMSLALAEKVRERREREIAYVKPKENSALARSSTDRYNRYTGFSLWNLFSSSCAHSSRRSLTLTRLCSTCDDWSTRHLFCRDKTAHRRVAMRDAASNTRGWLIRRRLYSRRIKINEIYERERRNPIHIVFAREYYLYIIIRMSSSRF